MFAVLFAGTQLFFAVYMMTPWGVPLMEMTEELSQTGADTLTLLENEAYMAQMMQSIPFILGGALLLLLPVLYVLRFSDYVLMDQPELGAAYALFSSFHMTRRNFVELLKLDLHFWWYYLLEAVWGQNRRSREAPGSSHQPCAVCKEPRVSGCPQRKSWNTGGGRESRLCIRQ